jgi:hypothetical protein
MDFFREVHVFLQVIWTVLFGTKWAFLHLENWDWVYEFLSELTQLSEGKLGLHAHALTNMVFLSSAPCVSSTYVNRTIWGKETLSVPWKIYVEKVFISEETQFPQGIKGLEVPASNTEGFLSRDSHVSSTQLKIQNRNQRSLSLPWILSCSQYSLQKLTQFSLGHNVVGVPASNTSGFLLRDTWVSPTQLNRPLVKNESPSPPWNT